MARPEALDSDWPCSSALLWVPERDMLGAGPCDGLGQQRVFRECALGDGGGPVMIVDRSEKLVQHEREVRFVAAVEGRRNRDLVARGSGRLDLHAREF